jgi:DNA-binding response OmpR family regulator
MLRKKRILIVDDDESLLESLTKILQVEGYDVETAKTGGEAVKKFKTQLYNLALLDIRLPDMDGTELLKIINGHIPRIVRIMITGYPSTENAVKALNLEADAYVMKPVDPKELLKTIQERLKEQDEADKVTEEKVTRWIKTRAEKL